MATYAPVAKASFSQTTVQNYLPLLSDGHHIVSRSGTIASGLGIFKRGTIMNVVPATGVATIGAAATDANCILMEDADATSATVPCLLLMAGKVKADALIWPGALGHGAVADNLRDFGILVESVVYTDGTLVKATATEADAQVAMAKLEQARGTEEEARRRKEGLTTADAARVEAKPGDSPWAYMTPEEREKQPELATEAAAVRPEGEGEGIGDGGGVLPDVPGVSINPTSATVLASGGTGSITVTKTSPGQSGTWTVDKQSTATWLTYTPTTPQSANGTISWTAAPNLTGQARSGQMYINGKTFTLNQGAV